LTKSAIGNVEGEVTFSCVLDAKGGVAACRVKGSSVVSTPLVADVRGVLAGIDFSAVSGAKDIRQFSVTISFHALNRKSFVQP